MAAGKSETKTRIASSGRRMQQETAARKVIYTEKPPVYRTHLPQLLLLTFCHAAGAEHTVPEKQSQEFPEKIISLVNGE